MLIKPPYLAPCRLARPLPQIALITNVLLPVSRPHQCILARSFLVARRTRSRTLAFCITLALVLERIAFLAYRIDFAILLSYESPRNIICFTIV